MKCKVAVITIALMVSLSNVLMSEDSHSDPKSASTESLVRHNAAYFVGKWVGEWELPRGRQEAILVIKEGKDGNYYCTYSWGFFQTAKYPTYPGSSNGIISIESDNTIIFKKPNFTITLTKKDDSTLKGLWERIGPTDPGKPAKYEGHFKKVK